MPAFDNGPGVLSYAGELRRELSLRNQHYAKRLRLLSRESYGETPSICYLPSEDGASHRDFAQVFDDRNLPQDARGFLSYQLIRNVLAAHHSQCSFCVMLDARRPDLREAWFAVMSCIRIVDLRLRCKVLTWKELAEVLPAKLQRFLREKYGIASG